MYIKESIIKTKPPHENVFYVCIKQKSAFLYTFSNKKAHIFFFKECLLLFFVQSKTVSIMHAQMLFMEFSYFSACRLVVSFYCRVARWNRVTLFWMSVILCFGVICVQKNIKENKTEMFSRTFFASISTRIWHRLRNKPAEPPRG